MALTGLGLRCAPFAKFELWFISWPFGKGDRDVLLTGCIYIR